MKFIKSRNQFEASNLTLAIHPSPTAYSYGHWCFLKQVQDAHTGRPLLVFNGYPYSTTTRAHQRKTLAKLRELGIKPDLYVETRSSLNNLSESSLDYLKGELEDRTLRLYKPRTTAHTKTRLEAEIRELMNKLESLRELLKSVGAV